MSQTQSRKREILPREEVEDDIDSLETGINDLKDELSEKENELANLQNDLKKAPPDAKEIAVGPACFVCFEYEPLPSDAICSHCETKVRRLFQMGKTAEQIVCGRSDLLAIVQRVGLRPAREALS